MLVSIKAATGPIARREDSIFVNFFDREDREGRIGRLRDTEGQDFEMYFQGPPTKKKHKGIPMKKSYSVPGSAEEVLEALRKAGAKGIQAADSDILKTIHRLEIAHPMHYRPDGEYRPSEFVRYEEIIDAEWLSDAASRGYALQGCAATDFVREIVAASASTNIGVRVLRDVTDELGD